MGCCHCIPNKTHEEILDTAETGEPDPSVPRNGSLYSDFSRIRNSRHLSYKTCTLSSKYTVNGIIGEGAYGIVRSAVCRDTSEERAVKSLLKSFVTKTESSRMFSEVDILSSLDHPNILRIYEVIEDVRYYHIVTALCTGGELLDRVLSSSGMTEERAAYYFYQVVSAVMHCHSHDILHRDIKPENLLLQDNSEDSPLIVIDFGLSRKEKKEAFKKCINPYYQAPEALEGTFTRESDIWSCGVVLYLMLGGYLPFPGKNEAQVARRINECKVEFPEGEWDTVSSLAKDLIRSMLSKDPLQRPTAYDVLNSDWIRTFSSKKQTNRVFCVDAFERLYRFRASLRLTHAVLEFVAAHYSAKNELEQLQRVFLTFDVNGDGMLSREEVISGINQLELPHLNAEDIVDQCDVNGNNHIDYTEFLTACVNYHQLLTTEKLESVFAAFDVDNSGYIDMKELKNALGGEELADEQVWVQVMKEVDLNEDGVIDIKEFEAALLEKESYFF